MQNDKSVEEKINELYEIAKDNIHLRNEFSEMTDSEKNEYLGKINDSEK